MSDALVGDWPPSIPKPPLPDGYQWICLRQAFGLKTANDEHPWWIRLSWTIRNGKKRILKIPGYFDTAEFAVHRAVDEARKHAERQKGKQQ